MGIGNHLGNYDGDLIVKRVLQVIGVLFIGAVLFTAISYIF